jgi:hypothetical protein
MSTETYCWMLVDGFFNSHRANNFIPPDRLVVDESFSRWHGQGGMWINHVLPNPKRGMWKNRSYGQIKLVKTAREQQAEDEDNNSLNHGSKVLLKLPQPWYKMNRLVCADSYLALVQTAKILLDVGLKFIGVVKTATKGCPKAHLNTVEPAADCGDRYGLISKDEEGNP